MTLAWVALGSNLDAPRNQLASATAALASLADTRLLARSHDYVTPPWGVIEQPDFVNAVAALATSLAPRELLDGLLAIERDHGRRRDGERWGPRTLDLDLLACGELVLDDAALTLPHPRLAARAFVLAPWAEIGPAFAVPGLGRVIDLLAAVDASNCRAIA